MSHRQLVAIALVASASIAFGCGPKQSAQMPRAQAPGGGPAHGVIPAPASIEIGAKGGFTVTPETAILVDAPNASRLTPIASMLAALLAPALPAAPAVREATGTPPANSIMLSLDDANAALGEEGYELTVTATGVRVIGRRPAAVFYGVQTLRQLLPWSVEYRGARPRALAIPLATVKDSPRFAWRGAMLDVSRHFFGVDEVKRYIDFLTLYKINRLHLHLSDDQGWRIEIKSWPNLTAHGSKTQVGGGAGGFYSQEQYKDLAKYAQDRFVMIIPEIDMPSHTNAALASYPELNCDGKAPDLYSGIEVGFSTFCVDKDVTYKFIADVVREINAITPGPYFHIGGDENQKLNAEQFRRFIERAQDIVQASGKEMIGWGDVAPSKLLPTTIVQHWQTDASKVAAAKGSRLIVSPASKSYLDMKYDKTTVLGLNWAGEIEVRTAYDWDPAAVLSGHPADKIIGVEAPLWTETIATTSDMDFMAFPRLPAVAEIGWSQAASKRWEEFRLRLGSHGPRWSAMGINFYRSPQVEWPLPRP